jgi:pimeloyl-ACP methyl ester carboxylesterase
VTRISFAEDLHKLVTQLKLHDFTLVGFSMGGDEVARYIGKYGSKGVSNAVISSGVPPYLLKTADNPKGLDASVLGNDPVTRFSRTGTCFSQEAPLNGYPRIRTTGWPERGGSPCPRLIAEAPGRLEL